MFIVSDCLVLSCVKVTNDGATILKSIGIDNPAAKILVGKHTALFFLSSSICFSFSPACFITFFFFSSNLIDISKVQDDEVGDGTTSVTVLAAELLREAEKLITAKIHPQTVIAGYRKAVTVARAALTAAAVDHGYM